MPHDLPFASGPTVANAAATILGGARLVAAKPAFAAAAWPASLP